jgi:hypothetical protein
MFGTGSGIGTFPWSGLDKFDVDDFEGWMGYFGSGIDADTFDGKDRAPSLPFSTSRNLFWREVDGVDELCISTSDSDLCTGGLTPGKPCTLNSQCGGGTCTNMCKVEEKTCTTETYHCSTDNAPCDGSYDCSGSNNFCILGELVYPARSSLLDCTEACLQKTICTGDNNGLCLGSKAYADTATYLGDGSISQFPAPDLAVHFCDCYLNGPTKYWSASATGTASLCTQNFE